MFLSQLNKISEEWGYLMLIATLLISIIAAIFIIIIPMIARRKDLFKRERGTLWVIVYYACLGLGYMLVEIYLIQKLVFFLEDPVFSISIVITSMLIISGIGSISSKRIAKEPVHRVRIATTGIGVSLFFYMFGLSPILSSLLGLPFILKIAISVLCIAPAGFFMGIPFPTGLSALTRTKEGLLPWAWGMNGALSVTGSVFARLLSVSYGFVPVLVCGILLYAVAGIIFPSNTFKVVDTGKTGRVQ
jgi:hypothetical protein